MPPRDLGYVRALFETLGDDPRLGRPPPPPALSGDHLDPAIRSVFLPGIKHGICHRFTSNDWLMPGCIAGDSRDGEVGGSCRLPLYCMPPTTSSTHSGPTLITSTPARFSCASLAIIAATFRMFGSMSSVGVLVAVILFYLFARR
jgi:hypothetical protein